MELTEDDLKAIAQVRLRKNKKLNWDRRYTVPEYSLATIGVVLFLFLGVFDKSIRGYIDSAILICVLAVLLIHNHWVSHVKKPYIKRFLQYWKEHKEFME
jgi:amino acid transporter